MIPVIITADRQILEQIVSDLKKGNLYHPVSAEFKMKCYQVADQIEKQLEPVCPLLEQIKISHTQLKK